MSFQAQLETQSARIQLCLDAALAPFGDLPFAQGMRHATRGGKRLRGFLVMEGAAVFDVPEVRAVQAAAAIEALHAYSLVHDDLPCMDDDDLRRGQPTVHVKWDEAAAVLAGDALQSLAFELVTDPACHPDPAVRAELALRLAKAAGRMVTGQAMDIAAETAPVPLSLAQITALQAGKTGALIGWSAQAGAVLGGQDPAPFARYADALGLAFQIADDILDVEGDAALAGKALGKDAGAGKATFVSHLGLEPARRHAGVLVEQACDALAPFGLKAEPLRAAARFVISRDL